MKKVAIYAGLFAVLASPLSALATTTGQSAAKSEANTVTITGTVSCSKFTGPVVPRKGFSVAETIRLCVSQGYEYTVVSGKNIYPLTGDKNTLAKLAGETVTVIGHLNPDQPTGASYALKGTVEATTVAPTKN
jgi:hypothetical protein